VRLTAGAVRLCHAPPGNAAEPSISRRSKEAWSSRTIMTGVRASRSWVRPLQRDKELVRNCHEPRHGCDERGIRGLATAQPRNAQRCTRFDSARLHCCTSQHAPDVPAQERPGGLRHNRRRYSGSARRPLVQDRRRVWGACWDRRSEQLTTVGQVRYRCTPPLEWFGREGGRGSPPEGRRLARSYNRLVRRTCALSGFKSRPCDHANRLD
jgi:hypothetical protein